MTTRLQNICGSDAPVGRRGSGVFTLPEGRPGRPEVGFSLSVLRGVFLFSI